MVSQYREMESSFYHYDGRTNTARLTDSAEVGTRKGDGGLYRKLQK